MAKQRPKILDQSSAMERILGVKKEENIVVDFEREKEDNVVEEKLTEKPAEKRFVKKRYVQTAFYITHEQHRAIKLRAANSQDPKEKDMSSVVRSAIDSYLKL